MEEKKTTISPSVLLDNWCATGSSLDELRETLAALEKRTSFVKMKSADINLLSLFEVKGIRDKGTEKVGSYLLVPGDFKPNISVDSIQKYYRTVNFPDHRLIDEWIEEEKIAFSIGGTETKRPLFYLASSNALQTLDRFGLSGNFLSAPHIVRDIAIAHVFEKNLGITTVVRNVGACRKIYSILSDKYENFPQTKTIFSIIKELSHEKKSDLGEPVCHTWNVTNFFTKVVLEFPERAETLSKLYELPDVFIPGVQIQTSDTGDSSFTITGTWRRKGSNMCTLSGEVKKRHSGRFDIEKLLEEVSKKIFEEYAKLPETLLKLMETNITNPEWDLTNAVFRTANKQLLTATFEEAFKQLGVVKCIGKKSKKYLMDEILGELDYSIPYTAYDIAMYIMWLPDRIVANNMKQEITALQKAVNNAPYINYEVDESLILA
jgi:hypothetical protein